MIILGHTASSSTRWFSWGRAVLAAAGSFFFRHYPPRWSPTWGGEGPFWIPTQGLRLETTSMSRPVFRGGTLPSPLRVATWLTGSRITQFQVARPSG